MTGEQAPGTRARILAVALELFGAHGYHRTTVRAIADRLGISKAVVFYHFPSKYDILAGLAEPLLAAMAAAVAEAAHDPRTARRRVLEGLLDVIPRIPVSVAAQRERRGSLRTGLDRRAVPRHDAGREPARRRAGSDGLPVSRLDDDETRETDRGEG
ncbi:TetR/AcrR family transcriptional regulator [Nocardia sp. MH4]|uniref:TetR/AcrR family transcriptional regulator n=1 Tax=Nocardia sp. MH4 TaxID=1768677 RepID=UPI001C4F2D47|nr:helix-turn-helix domain-containing protein [Nocardia sp. MH4]